MRILYSLLLALLAGSASAQIAPTRPGYLRAANRQALRDARRAETDYQDSHLRITPKQLKRGATTAAPQPADAPRLGRDGRPRDGNPRHRPTEPIR